MSWLVVVVVGLLLRGGVALTVLLLPSISGSGSIFPKSKFYKFRQEKARFHDFTIEQGKGIAVGGSGGSGWKGLCWVGN